MRRIYLIVAAAVVAIDQLTKWAVLARFSPDDIRPIIPGLFSLVRVENRGIAFGMLAGLSSSAGFVLIVIVSTAVLGLLLYLLWHADAAAPRTGMAFAFILGGAAGNLIDRIFRGRVVDFLDFYFRDYHWPAFNVADSAICVGAGLLLLDLILARPTGETRLERPQH
jgi:signal peptidase II